MVTIKCNFIKTLQNLSIYRKINIFLLLRNLFPTTDLLSSSPLTDCDQCQTPDFHMTSLLTGGAATQSNIIFCQEASCTC